MYEVYVEFIISPYRCFVWRRTLFYKILFKPLLVHSLMSIWNFLSIQWRVKNDQNRKSSKCKMSVVRNVLRKSIQTPKCETSKRKMSKLKMTTHPKQNYIIKIIQLKNFPKENIHVHKLVAGPMTSNRSACSSIKDLPSINTLVWYR